MKYLASILVALGMLFAGTSTAFAGSKWNKPAPAPAPAPEVVGGDIAVKNLSSAYVNNTAIVSSNTGGNTADGGDALASRKNLGNGGAGGDVRTGDAVAISEIINDVNRNDTVVRASCDCPGDIQVVNKSTAKVVNTAVVSANTGFNSADGGNGRNGGVGGDVRTGDAHAYSDILNIVNTNKTTITRN